MNFLSPVPQQSNVSSLWAEVHVCFVHRCNQDTEVYGTWWHSAVWWQGNSKQGHYTYVNILCSVIPSWDLGVLWWYPWTLGKGSGPPSPGLSWSCTFWTYPNRSQHRGVGIDWRRDNCIAGFWLGANCRQHYRNQICFHSFFFVAQIFQSFLWLEMEGF